MDRVNERKLRKTYRKRRRHKEHLRTDPFQRRLGKRIEHLAKRLFLRMVSRWIDPREVVAPLDPNKIKNILIIRNDAIGDMVLTTPFWRILKQKYPHIKIGIVGSVRNMPVVAHDTDVDYRFECNGTSIGEVWRVARNTRKQDWDLVFPMIYNKKTKMAILSKLFASRALSSMVLLADDPAERYERLFSICVPTSIRPDDGPLLDLMRLHLERTLKMNIKAEEWRPSLLPDESAIRSVQSLLRIHLDADKNCNYFHINLDAKMEFKEFGLANSLELSKQLLGKFFDHSIIWTASPIVAQSVEDFLKMHSIARIHFQPTRSIHELIGIVRGSSLVISPDTSVIHVASAESRPVVGLYPFHHEWPPYKVPNRVLTPTYGQPVSTIPVGKVFDAVKELVEENIMHGKDIL